MDTKTWNCVVCVRPIADGAEHYANAWEKARQRFPCCSAACAQAFDADRHWIPAVPPRPASDEEQARLLTVVRGRLRDGDKPTVVLREMLLAGVSPTALRRILFEAGIVSHRNQQTAKELSMIGGLLTLVAGSGAIFRSRDKRNPAALEEAQADLDRWEGRLREAKPCT